MMIYTTRTGRPLPATVTNQIGKVPADAVSRREFLALASAFGATAATAYAMLGTAQPAMAQSTPQMGGTVRTQASVRALKDPRAFDYTETANFVRGWLEPLVTYENDGTFTPTLLESWEINDDATEYVLRVRPGVTWNDGTPFTAEDVAFNIIRWCDSTFEGNSMAGRFAVLVDEATGKAREGGIEVADASTVILRLPRPDISLIPAMAEYLAAVVPQDFSAETMLSNPKGTGPYLPEVHEVGVRAVLVRNTAHKWWNDGSGAWMDRIEFVDLGADTSTYISAMTGGEVDMTYDSAGDFIIAMDAQEDFVRNEIATAATVVIRPNQMAEVEGKAIYSDVRVRKALQMAIDNAKLLELGYSNQGVVAENHHVGPMHPEYSPMDPPVYDPAAAVALLQEAGLADFEHELICDDEQWRADTADAAAAQLRDAGIKVRRVNYPGSTFYNDWNKYPFSTTNWNHRPLAVQMFAIAYRSGAAWNEFGFANAEFDTLLDQALATADTAERAAIVAKMQKILRDEGVTVQPYWRSLINHTRKGLGGGERHIAAQMFPERLFWAA